ncbi:MAG TPA: hypothetical protein GXZ85_08220 [Firmicutes bacterium]|jgi:hypothetical protein|nr:hypothetical protein [Bacillota bacterium]
MKKRHLAFALLLVILLGTPTILANEIDQERIDLFLSSQRLLREEQTPPKMKVGMVLSTLGTDSEVSLGARVESRIDKENKVHIITETSYLKGEQTLAGFLSLKFTPFSRDKLAMYVGAGAGYANGFKFQVFAGVDFTKNFFAETRYVNHLGGIGNTRLHLATGVQFTY